MFKIKRNLISLLIILAIFFRAFCSAQIPLPKSCPKIPTFKNLDLSKFEGQWYEAARYFFIPEITGRCISVNYAVKEDSSLHTEIRLKSFLTNSTAAFLGTTHFVDIPTEMDGVTGNLQLTLKLVNSIFPSKSAEFTYQYKLIDTDYTNYAIKWSCSKAAPIGLAHFENVWILIRDTTYTEELEGLARTRLARLGIDQSLIMKSICP